jgi:hypothetical protein
MWEVTVYSRAQPEAVVPSKEGRTTKGFCPTRLLTHTPPFGHPSREGKENEDWIPAFAGMTEEERGMTELRME